MTPRSWLFVPGDSPAKMAKALTCGADALILDLEDSVAPARKDEARQTVSDFLATSGRDGPQLWVRINPLTAPFAASDIAAIALARPVGIVLPKPDSAADLAKLDGLLSAAESAAGFPQNAIRVMPIATETPLSLFNLHTYAGASARLAALTWGAEDLSSAIGAVTARGEHGHYTPLYEMARSLCLAGAAAASVPAIETVYPNFSDAEGLGGYLERSRRDGFSGMMAIHPSQVGPINAAFTPSKAELDQARRIVELFAANPDAGTLALGGQMLDAPHLIQARRVLDRDI